MTSPTRSSASRPPEASSSRSVRSRRFRAVAAVLAASLAVSACTRVVNPATGEAEFTSIDRAEERALGQQNHPKVLAENGGQYDDPAINAYIEDLGERVLGHTELAGEDFTFTVVDSPIVNAFALPGGYIYFTRGLLALANNEAEVAGVMAHEIGHVTARHTAKRIDQAQLGGIGQLAATIIGGLLLGQGGAQLGQQLGGLGAAAYVQGYSREQEFEADDLGVRYMSRAGYDPNAMATFLGQLGEHSALEAEIAGRDADTFSWFSSHPRSADRVERAAARALEADPGTKLERDRFLDAVDGLTYGDSAAQGFVRGRSLIHPELLFSITAPEGWRLTNRPDAVIGTAPSGGFSKFDFGQAPRGTDLARYMREEWAGGARIGQFRSFRAQAGEAVSGVGRITLRSTERDALFAVVRGQGDRLYRFVYAPPRDVAAERATLEEAIAQTRNLTVSEAQRIRPLELRVVTVRPGDTPESLARRMAVEREPLARFLLINDLEPGERLTPGQRVKIITDGGATS